MNQSLKPTLVTITLALGLALAAPCMAQECSDSMTKSRAQDAALAIESISTAGGTPLTLEAHSLSSEIDTWGVILSYSGVQRVYRVTVSSDTCQIRKVVLE